MDNSGVVDSAFLVSKETHDAYASDRVSKISKSLQDGIKETNRCLVNWQSEASKRKSLLDFITHTEVKALFLNWFKQILKHYVGDIDAKRFCSKHQCMISLNGLNGQIQGITFTPSGDHEHHLFPDVQMALRKISYKDLYSPMVGSIDWEKQKLVASMTTEGGGIKNFSLSSIENITF